MWALATAGYDNADVYRGIVARLSPRYARTSKPQELSNAVWALATAEVPPKFPDTFDNVLVPAEQRFSGGLQDIDDPTTACFGIAASELMRRPFDFKSQEIKDILWSFLKVCTLAGGSSLLPQFSLPL